MYRVKVITSFSAAHFLRNYKGKCENLHGHNWKVEVIIESKKLDPSGMVIDFGALKKIANEILDDLDHRNLSDLEYFRKRNASSEEIARYVFDRLEGKLTKRDYKINEVRIWETENSCAIFSK